MKVLLTKHVPGKGRAGDIIDVSPGYAQNFLYKQGFAKAATKKAIDTVKAKERKHQKQKQQIVSAATSTANKLAGKTFTIVSKATDDGLLYAAVHEKQIAAAIKKQLSLDVAPKDLTLATDMKQIGKHMVHYKHKSGATATFTIHIEAE